jgi:hypothetical protein
VYPEQMVRMLIVGFYFLHQRQSVTDALDPRSQLAEPRRNVQYFNNIDRPRLVKASRERRKIMFAFAWLS